MGVVLRLYPHHFRGPRRGKGPLHPNLVKQTEKNALTETGQGYLQEGSLVLAKLQKHRASLMGRREGLEGLRNTCKHTD